MIIDPVNFVLSLAAALTDAANEAGGDALTVGRDVFALQAVEGIAATAYAVFRKYGGPAPEELQPVPAISVQCMATSQSQAAAERLAQRLFEACSMDFDGVIGQGPPRNHWTIPAKSIVNGAVADDATRPLGWIVHLITLAAPPAAVGVDERHLVNVPFNFDVTFDSLDA